MEGRSLEAKQALADYRAWLVEQPLARSTRVSYGTKVSRFVQWINNHTTVGDFVGPPESVQNFARSLKDEGLAPRTINAYLAAVSSFYRFLGLAAPKGVWQQPDLQSRPRTLSTEEQRRLLLAAIDRSSRDLAVVT